MRVYILYFDGDDGYHAISDDYFVVGIYTTFDLLNEAMEVHAKAFKTNNGEPLDFSISRAVVDVAKGRYLPSPYNVDELPDYRMRVN
jgi:hypothetical protein